MTKAKRKPVTPKGFTAINEEKTEFTHNRHPDVMITRSPVDGRWALMAYGEMTRHWEPKDAAEHFEFVITPQIPRSEIRGARPHTGAGRASSESMA